MNERVFVQEHVHLALDAATEGKDPVTGQPVVSIPGVFTMEGVMNGAYKPASEVEDPRFWRFFDGLPFRLDHPPQEVGVVMSASELAGYVDRPFLQRADGRPAVGGSVNVWKRTDQGKRALQRIRDGFTDVSIGFWVTPLRKEGTYHDPALDVDLAYQQVETDMHPDHLALVDVGACTPDMGCGLKTDVLRAFLEEWKQDSPWQFPDRPRIFVSGTNMLNRSAWIAGHAQSARGVDDDPAGDGGRTVTIAQKEAMTGGPRHGGAPPEPLHDDLPPIFGGDRAVPLHTSPKAPEETPWSFSAADGDAILERGGWPAYRDAHAWFDSSEEPLPERKNAYKLPHHKIVGGSVKVVWRGVTAAAVVIQGGRGGLDIPPGDLPGVKRHVTRHYEQFDREAPWDREGDTARGWLYPEEAEALEHLLLSGAPEAEGHPWTSFDVREGERLTIKARFRDWIARFKGGTTAPMESESMTEKECEKALAEKAELAAKLEATEGELAKVQKALDRLREERDEERRTELLTRLENVTGKGSRAEKALQGMGFLAEDQALEDLSLEDLEVAAKAAEWADARAKPLGSAGVESEMNDEGWTVGIPGVHFRKPGGD